MLGTRSVRRLAAMGAAAVLLGTAGVALSAQVAGALTGTAAIAAGPLSATLPGALSWSDTLNGFDQTVVDTNSADQSYTVTDATGSAAGWHVTVSATTFTCSSGPNCATARTLANSGTFSTNGSTSSATATAAPTVACAAGSTCSGVSNGVTYPVAITTAASGPTAYTVLSSGTGKGMGAVTVSNVGWWIAVPASTYAGTYVSTVTIAVVAGP